MRTAPFGSRRLQAQLGQTGVSDYPSQLNVVAGADYTVGPKSSSTVVAVGRNGDGQCNVGGGDLN